MAYAKTNRLIMRRVPSGITGRTIMPAQGLGGLSWSDITGGVKSVLNTYGTYEQNKGAVAATTQANKDLAAALAAKQGGGIDTTTLLIGAGALGLIALIALRK